MVAPRRILITGCSGGGKSSLLDEMARRGWAVCAEPGRRVIADQHASGGSGLPWHDMTRFAHLCRDMARADWQAAQPGVTLFDRGITDAHLALVRLGQAGLDDAILARHPYDLAVLAPPWPALFTNDPARRHDLAEAMVEYDHIAASLPLIGYDAVILPKLPLAERADWLESRLRNG